MANRPDPNNPQPGDRFNSDSHTGGGRRTILARLGGYCASDYHDGNRPRIDSVTWIAANWKPAPPTPPDVWAGMGHGSTWIAPNKCAAAEYARCTGGVLVHYVGKVVEP